MNEVNNGAAEPYRFFLVAVQLHYTEGEAARMRNMNIQVRVPDFPFPQVGQPRLGQHFLSGVHSSALSRLEVESGITPDKVLDCIFLGIMDLGSMTEEEYYRQPTQVADAEEIEEEVIDPQP